MPVGEAITSIADLAIELIKALNPSELERLKKEIRKKEKEIEEMREKNEERRRRLKEALASGDIDSVVAILDE